MEKLTLSIPEFCARVGVGKSLAYLMIKDGTLDVCRIRGRTFVTIASVERLIAESTKKDG